MPVPQLNLDDRTFDQLVAEARALIPRYLPAWTDYNPSDPGITLLELFAFLIEAAIYQLDRVPEHSLERFAGLIGVQRSPGEPIEQTLRRALDVLAQRSRAVTAADFEALAVQANPAAVARARAAIVSPSGFEQSVNVVIVPVNPALSPVQWDSLRQQVFQFLAPRRLIATKLKVAPPDYTVLVLTVIAARDDRARLDAASLAGEIEQAVRTFLDPNHGGFDGAGWPFGRSVFRSELYRVIEGLGGVDHVRELRMNGDENVAEIPLSSPASLVTLIGLSVSVVDP